MNVTGSRMDPRNFSTDFHRREAQINAVMWRVKAWGMIAFGAFFILIGLVSGIIEIYYITSNDFASIAHDGLIAVLLPFLCTVIPMVIGGGAFLSVGIRRVLNSPKEE